jgi:hypothetical protein
VRPTATPCYLSCKGLHSNLTIAAGVSRSASNGFGRQGRRFKSSRPDPVSRAAGENWTRRQDWGMSPSAAAPRTAPPANPLVRRLPRSATRWCAGCSGCSGERNAPAPKLTLVSAAAGARSLPGSPTRPDVVLRSGHGVLDLAAVLIGQVVPPVRRHEIHIGALGRGALPQFRRRPPCPAPAGIASGRSAATTTRNPGICSRNRTAALADTSVCHR